MIKRKKQTVKLSNGEKAIVNRERLTVEYRGKTIDLEAVANMMIDIEQSSVVYTLRKAAEGNKIIVRKL